MLDLCIDSVCHLTQHSNLSHPLHPSTQGHVLTFEEFRDGLGTAFGAQLWPDVIKATFDLFDTEPRTWQLDFDEFCAWLDTGKRVLHKNGTALGNNNSSNSNSSSKKTAAAAAAATAAAPTTNGQVTSNHVIPRSCIYILLQYSTCYAHCKLTPK